MPASRQHPRQSHSGRAREGHQNRQDGPFAVEVVFVGICRQYHHFFPYLRPPFKRNGRERCGRRGCFGLGLAADAAVQPTPDDVQKCRPRLVVAVAADPVGECMEGRDVGVGQAGDQARTSDGAAYDLSASGPADALVWQLQR